MHSKVSLRATLIASLLTLGVMASANAANIAVSIGIRETGTTAAIGDNGGTTGGIEFVNLDAQLVPADGLFHTVTFNFQTDPLTAFAGATANSLYDGTRGVLEHVRLRNIDGITVPLAIYIDNIVNTLATGASTTVQDFESAAIGTEVTFQEPPFSGSTSANVLPNGTSLVSAAAASQGLQSDQILTQFVDATNTRWIRLTTFNTPNQPNPTIDFAPGSTLTFDIMIVPEPASLAGLAGLVLVARRRRF